MCQSPSEHWNTSQIYWNQAQSFIMRGAVVITLTIATYALFLVMLQGEGVDAEIEGNGNNTRLCSILVDKPTNLDECIAKCEKIACQYI